MDIAVTIFVLGCLVGSFLNVCIYRIPIGKSVVSPGSSCPGCGALIRWYQNVPILSWVFLGGKCAGCKASISVRYPMVEALNGLLYVLAFLQFGLTLETVVYWLFLSLLVVITFIDLDHQLIPNVLSLPGIVFGLLFALFVLPVGWQDSILGTFAGGGFLWAVAAGYRLLMGADGMGMGDVKLLAMIGAFLGWQAVFPVVFLGSLVGTFVAVPYMWFKGQGGKLAIPFGPFLSIGAVLYLFWWAQLFNWYVDTFFPKM